MISGKDLPAGRCEPATEAGTVSAQPALSARYQSLIQGRQWAGNARRLRAGWKAV